MTKRAAHTLLIVKSDLLARADFGPLPRCELLGFWQQGQTGNARLYYSIDAAMKLGGKSGRDVWVIGEEFWTQTLNLPASAVAGLDREQIAKSIGFDVESLTGIAGSDAVLGFTEAAPEDESAHFWVTQIATVARGQIQKSIETAGGRMAGLVHPGGLPEPVNQDARSAIESREWRRIEVWNDTTLCISGHPGQPRRITVINGDPNQDAWHLSVTQWITANHADVSEWLGPQGTMAGALSGAWTQVSSLKGDVLKSWLGRWMLELAHGAKHVPTIAPIRQTGFTQKQIGATAAIACVCLACCIGRGLWLNHQETTAIAERDEAMGPKRQLDELDRKVATLRSQLTREQTANAKAHRALPADPASVDRQRPRLEALLSALAQNAEADLVIDHIASESAGVVLIEGKCLTPTAIDDFTRRLATTLPPNGWEVTPARKLVPDGGSIGGPCEFRIRVLPSLGSNANSALEANATRHGGAG